MKKMLIFGVGVLLAAGAVFLAVANKPLTAEEALLMANLEAIAAGESWEAGGQTWDNDDHWYNDLGNAWTPVTVSCTRTVSVGIGATYIEESYNGEMVECAGGSGNCWNGTPCYPI